MSPPTSNVNISMDPCLRRDERVVCGFRSMFQNSPPPPNSCLTPPYRPLNYILAPLVYWFVSWRDWELFFGLVMDLAMQLNAGLVWIKR